MDRILRMFVVLSLTLLKPVCRFQTNEPKLSSSALNKFLLNTLAHPSNPITHSDIGQRSGTMSVICCYDLFIPFVNNIDHVFSASTGHQVSEGRRGGQRLWSEDREHKLARQREANSSSNMPQIFHNVRVYINGFLDNTTDIEMKRIIMQCGGQIVYAQLFVSLGILSDLSICKAIPLPHAPIY